MIICPECCATMVVLNESEDTGICFVEFDENTGSAIRVAYGSLVHCAGCGKAAFEIQGFGMPSTSSKFWDAAKTMYRPGFRYIAFQTPTIEGKEE